MSRFRGTANIVGYEDHMVVPKTDGLGWNVLIRMELLTTLPDHYQRSPLNETEIVKLGVDICRALELCEKFNIVHRDIKPQNIFINDFGDYKLGDFGVARAMEHTTHATKIGTYSYMAPEVYNNLPYSAFSDLYSLGMVLYWLLNERRLPFVPMPPVIPTPNQNSDAQTRRFAGEPIHPPKHGSDEFKYAVLKACAYNPADRYRSASEMYATFSSIYERLLNHGRNSTFVPVDNAYGGFLPANCDTAGKTYPAFQDPQPGVNTQPPYGAPMADNYGAPFVPPQPPAYNQQYTGQEYTDRQPTAPESVGREKGTTGRDLGNGSEMSRRKRIFFAIIPALTFVSMLILFIGNIDTGGFYYSYYWCPSTVLDEWFNGYTYDVLYFIGEASLILIWIFFGELAVVNLHQPKAFRKRVNISALCVFAICTIVSFFTLYSDAWCYVLYWFISYVTIIIPAIVFRKKQLCEKAPLLITCVLIVAALFVFPALLDSLFGYEGYIHPLLTTILAVATALLLHFLNKKIA